MKAEKIKEKIVKNSTYIYILSFLCITGENMLIGIVKTCVEYIVKRSDGIWEKDF